MGPADSRDATNDRLVCYTPARRHNYGRKRPLGCAAENAPQPRASRRSRIAQCRCRGVRPPRGENPDGLRLLHRKLVAPQDGSKLPDAHAAKVPRAAAQENDGQQYRARGDREDRRPSRRSAGGLGRSDPPHPEQHGPARVPGAQLRRPGRNRGRRQGACRKSQAGRADAGADRRDNPAAPPLHRFEGRAVSPARPDNSHRRRDAAQQFPAVAGLLRGILRHRRVLARFPPGKPAHRNSRIRPPHTTIRGFEGHYG